MNGYEKLKEYRENAGLTVRAAASKVGITFRNLEYYDSGNRDIVVMPIKCAIELFELYNENLEMYVESYYPYKREMDADISQWKANSTYEMDYKICKRRFYQQLAKLKERQRMDPAALEQVKAQYQFVFDAINPTEDGKISHEDYRQKIIPLNGMIEENKMDMSLLSSSSKKIASSICRSGYTLADVAQLISVTPQLLRKYMKGTLDISSMQCGNALRLCYLLKLDPRAVFISAEDT